MVEKVVGKKDKYFFLHIYSRKNIFSTINTHKKLKYEKVRPFKP